MKIVFETIALNLEVQFGFVAGVTSGCIDKESFCLKVVGDRSTWTNNISQNSPVQMTFWKHSGDDYVEMSGFSHQMRDAGMKKMRKTRFKSEEELLKKMTAYFSKNAEYLSEFKV